MQFANLVYLLHTKPDLYLSRTRCLSLSAQTFDLLCFIPLCQLNEEKKRQSNKYQTFVLLRNQFIRIYMAILALINPSLYIYYCTK